MNFGFKKGSYRQNIAVLASGTAMAQAIPIAMSPILTRLYSPEDFGVLALYVSVVAILATLSTAHYEQAITLPSSNDEAASIVTLTIKICAAFSLVTLLVVTTFNAQLAQLLGHAEISQWLYLLPLSIFATGVFSAYKFWCNRRSQYKSIAAHSIQISIVTVTANVLLGLLKVPGGQIFGTLIGRAVSALSLFRSTSKRDKSLLQKQSLAEQKAAAKRFKAHPMFFLPSQLVSVVAQQIPVFMISSLFLIQTVGFFSLALRLVALPTALIANAIGDVYRQRIAEAYNINGNFHSIYINTLKTTILVSLVPFALLYFTAPHVFAFVFGDEWRIAGDYAQILVVSTFFSFITTPLNKGSIVVNAKRYALTWNLARLIAYAGLWVIALALEVSIEQLLWLWVLANICLYVTDAYFQYTFSKRY